MHRRSYALVVRPAVLSVAFLGALSCELYATPPEWAAANGNANQGSNWTTGALPGSSDIAKIANGTANVTAPLTFGALDFSGGTISGTSSLTLSLATSSWTAGEVSSATVGTAGLNISGTRAKKGKKNGKLGPSRTEHG